MFIIEKIFCIIFLASFFVAGWLIFWERFKETEKEAKCPICHQLWAAENYDEEFLGMFRKNKLRLSSFVVRERGTFYGSNPKTSWYEKYKIYYRCKYCGYEWVSFKSKDL